MRGFLLWVAVSAMVWGGAGYALHTLFSAAPRHVLVAVDASLAMEPDWDRVPAVLDAIDDAPYTTFSLVTPRGPIHDEAGRLRLGQARPYGPRDLSPLAEADRAADRRILVTNAPEDALSDLDGWEVVRP